MEKISKEFVQQCAAELKNKSNIVILAHKNPDGDALGSGLAIVNYLKKLDKNPTFIVPNKLPTYLHWMPFAEDVISFKDMKEKALSIIELAELIIIVDLNHPGRLGDMADVILAHKAPKIMVDHHPYPEDIADIVYSRVSSSSTAEMVYELLSSLSNTTFLPKAVAECLYVGILTDTGSFRYNSSNQLTFDVVGHLLESGINKDYITDKVFDNFSESRLRLLGYALNNKMVVKPEFGTAYISLSEQELTDFNFKSGDTEGFVNYPLSINGIVFAVFFIEKGGVVKCSFRSKGNFPANKVSQDYFSGGGHMNAAGGISELSLPDTISKFESILPEYKKYLEF